MLQLSKGRVAWDVFVRELQRQIVGKRPAQCGFLKFVWNGVELVFQPQPFAGEEELFRQLVAFTEGETGFTGWFVCQSFVGDEVDVSLRHMQHGIARFYGRGLQRTPFPPAK